MNWKILNLMIRVRRMKKKGVKVEVHPLICCVKEYLVLEIMSQDLIQGLMEDWKNCYILQCFDRLNCGYLDYWSGDHRSGDVKLLLVQDQDP